MSRGLSDELSDMIYGNFGRNVTVVNKMIYRCAFVAAAMVMLGSVEPVPQPFQAFKCFGWHSQRRVPGSTCMSCPPCISMSPCLASAPRGVFQQKYPAACKVPDMAGSGNGTGMARSCLVHRGARRSRRVACGLCVLTWAARWL